MLRIRRIYDDTLPANRQQVEQVQAILRSRFAAVAESEIASLGERLRNPFLQRFRPVLFVAENIRHKVLGFALMLHEPELGFCFLDWIAMAGGRAGGGTGGALYDRVRTEAAALGARALFFECLPDEADLCPDPALLKENRSRLRFYERYGARPVVGTAYETPVSETDTCMPHLVCDMLDRPEPLRRAFVRRVIRAILERKYAALCPPEYVEKVVASVRQDPVALRPLRYLKPAAVRSAVDRGTAEPIALVVNDRHIIHHVHERGYVEAPVRVESILKELDAAGIFTRLAPRPFADRHLTAVHDAGFVAYLRRACMDVPENKSLYPYVFPIRNKTRPPKEPSVLAGYYCIDTFTPIHRNAWPAARRAVDCTLTAAREILDGRRLAYALVRPPGHHAERRSFGGFCYFNNNAVAAHYLSAHGTVAILDIDYHHGNGQQDIFYDRADVLTVSIHGHPRFAYPYFSGFEDERGQGEGEGFNLNLALPESVDGARYREALVRALKRIDAFGPRFLVVALGLDTGKRDPTGTWRLSPGDFAENGKMIGALGLPTLVVQEGGYRQLTLGRNARQFFAGLAEGHLKTRPLRPGRRKPPAGLAQRYEVACADPRRIAELVRRTGFFNEEEIAVAAELAQERLAKRDASGYHFILVDNEDRLAGYTCYGPIPATAASYDLYWIAVHPDSQGKGLGRRLMAETEGRIHQAGGKRIYVETSTRAQYTGTRAFYERCGYRLESVLEDFYGPGDGKATYCKTLA